MTEGQSFRFELRRIYWTRQCLRLLVVVSAVWLFVAAYLFFARPRALGDFGIDSFENVIREVFGGLWIAIGPPAAFIVMLLVLAIALRTSDVRRRDPQRRFTRHQRREGMLRAGGICELESGYGRRCSRAAEHGDHFYPWSKGGATSLRNFVAACSHCNRHKGASIPSPGLLMRLERRRASGTGMAVPVGERRRLRSA
ncbi:HNH endonuclease signature motif containing protein [Paenarthrobacter sp. Y-19]|uniref:HNH endonuclease n=1 Tax=Paenarthrobacter sp. Y-19 TaxID=3031125 RepID=UPI0031F3ACED